MKCRYVGLRMFLSWRPGLPVSVKQDKIEANFEKEILKVTLPKSEEPKKKEIEIKVK